MTLRDERVATDQRDESSFGRFRHYCPFDAFNYCLFLCAADGHLAHLNRRDSDANRHALSFLAAHSHAWVERKIAAHCRHMFERLGAVAAQSCPLDWRCHSSVLDQIGLGGAE